ncbi:MBL fold metallo-hydrolase [Prevotella sp. KH2C16]|uniref:MBL fold metallo-hydrolase n=1 Tax=Prevotella sp. KH2C16 TaxID=1855325 RepID=UPI0008F068DF|nr:MBL fold metallo-hydrolase [Prevotella sp. KH2C16]SFF93791.1 Glyoxylase, beta-lactamase superfamily II [Prevotella sp. KH2C16]
MLKIERFTCNMLQENCYVVNDESNECIIIDCGAFLEEERKDIVDYIHENKLTPKHLIATHGHIDHNFGNNIIYQEFGLRPEVHKNDKYLMEELPEQAQAITGVVIEYDMPTVGKYLDSTDKILFGNHVFTIIETPGHSRGSVFFYCKEENVAFSGDTLFRGSIGRTDFAGGSMFQIIQSLRIIGQLPDETKIYPGHGNPTTIGLELATNPYMDR